MLRPRRTTAERAIPTFPLRIFHTTNISELAEAMEFDGDERGAEPTSIDELERVKGET
ncbi:MAG: hypothetical protein QNJ44_09225 [Rhodobacter sp.]|nr:hypothetical protein [Rhodobacter sp.]